MNRTMTWDVGSDKIARDITIKLRDVEAANAQRRMYETWSNQTLNQRIAKRMKPLMKAQVIMNQPLSGTIIDMGSGTGVISACLSKLPDVQNILAVDYSRGCHEEILPVVCKRIGAVEDKITPVVGSFNAMELDNNSIDFIVSQAVLHHCEDLLQTARENFRVLKPGEWCIHSDKAIPSSVPASKIHERESQPISISHEKMLSRFGSSIDVEYLTKEMASSHVVRLCDIEYAFTQAGFTTYAFYCGTLRKGLIDACARIFSHMVGDYLFRLRKDCIFGFTKFPYYQWFMVQDRYAKIYKGISLLLVCQKPQEGGTGISENPGSSSPLKGILGHIFKLRFYHYDRELKEQMDLFYVNS